jgi:hypothetical protein
VPGGRRRVIAETRKLRHARRRGKATRRVGSIPPEQEDRFAEPRRAAGGDLANATCAVDERDQSRRCRAPLLERGLARIRRARLGRGGERIAPAKLDADSIPALEHRAPRRVARRAARPVPIEPLEIEGACAESENPAPDRGRHDTAMLGDALQGNSVGESLSDGVQNDVDTGDLAGQRIARQHALAMPATAAAR